VVADMKMDKFRRQTKDDSKLIQRDIGHPESATPKRINHKFPPIFDANSKILILGTLPSVKSRETHFYYGHPQNRFWLLLAKLTKSEVPQTIEEKKSLLRKNKIAIWDVIQSCEITGSSDSSIKNVTPVNLAEILSQCKIKKIYSNGQKAKELYDRYLKKDTGREIVPLPSTSPANASYTLDRLVESWNIIIEES
jgi:hypoxanthine-DNA glycosylase